MIVAYRCWGLGHKAINHECQRHMKLWAPQARAAKNDFKTSWKSGLSRLSMPPLALSMSSGSCKATSCRASSLHQSPPCHCQQSWTKSIFLEEKSWKDLEKDFCKLRSKHHWEVWQKMEIWLEFVWTLWNACDCVRWGFGWVFVWQLTIDNVWPPVWHSVTSSVAKCGSVVEPAVWYTVIVRAVWQDTARAHLVPHQRTLCQDTSTTRSYCCRTIWFGDDIDGGQ